MKLSNAFLDILPAPLILFGAGDGGKYCYEYLQQIHQENNIIAFVDNDSSKQNKTKQNKI